MVQFKILFLLLLACIGHLRCGAQNGDGSASAEGFELLPLEVVAAIPSTLLVSSDSPILIQGAAALQVVFSQPVIRLGADFGSESINAPFSVEFVDGSPLLGEGLLQRWVTTYIWRIDPPDLGWPTDADLTLKWNQMLTSWTGADLVTDVQVGPGTARSGSLNKLCSLQPGTERCNNPLTSNDGVCACYASSLV